MIPKSKAYATSTVAPAKTRGDIEAMLDKFGVKKGAWVRDDPQISYILFRKMMPDMAQEVTYKVSIPFIEKEERDPERSWKKITVHDEIRSYRFFFHIFKGALLNAEIGMTFEEMFSNYIVIGQEDGVPVTFRDKVVRALTLGKLPSLTVKAEG